MWVTHNATVTDETDYGHDQQGRLIDVYSVVLQGVRHATFAGLSNGNPTFTSGTPLTTVDAYDPAGNLASETDANGVVTTDTYDSLNRLTGLSVAKAGALIFTESYDLRDDGLRSDVTDTRYQSDGTTVFSQTKINWTYDADGRLTSEALTVLAGGGNAPAAYADVFKFDLASNRVEEDISGSSNATIVYSNNADDQLLTETRSGDGAYTIAYGYDNNGSLTSQVRTGTNPETDSYVYDVRNRMTLATVNGTNTTYVYDDDGVRVSEATGANATFYLNDPQNPTGNTKAVEESATQNSATVARAYVFGGSVIAQSDSTHGVLYLMHDGHGSTRALLTTTGAIQTINGIEQRYDYGAYGALLVSAGGQSNASAALTPWLFGGDGLFDSGSGFTYHLARWRDQFHFTSADATLRMPNDPLLAGGYLYGSANAMGHVDPSGQLAQVALVAIAGLIALVFIMIVGGATSQLQHQLLHIHFSFNFGTPAIAVTSGVAVTATNPYRKAGLPTRRGSYRFIPPKGSSPKNPVRGPGGGWIDKFGNEWVKGPPHHFPDEDFEWDVQKPDGTYDNVSPDGVKAN